MTFSFRKASIWLVFYLGGMLVGAVLIGGALFVFLMSNFHMPGDGPLYSYAGWHDDLPKIPGSKIDRNAKPLPYALINIDGEPEKNKYYSSFIVNTVLNAGPEKITPSSLAATCAAGAKYYAQKYQQGEFGPDAVHFKIFEDEKDSGREEWRVLADCLYSPRGVGWDSREDHPWEWQDLRVRERPFTEKELEVKNTLATMHTPEGYTKAGRHNVFWAREDTGRITGMSSEEVFKIELFKNKGLFPSSIFKNIQPEGPVKQSGLGTSHDE